MSALTLIARSIRFYWRTHLGVVLGVALATMVLTGSLLVGDSVKATLRRQAELRVGTVETAMLSGDRFFREELAEEVGGQVAPVLLLRGSVAKPDGSARVNQVQVLGVDERYWGLGLPPADFYGRSGATALVSQRLAEQLAVKDGDSLIVRVEKPSLFSRDAPLSGEENEIVSLRVVAEVVGDQSFDRFSLHASQVPPSSIFLPLAFLQERFAMAGRANLLLAAARTADVPPLRAAVEAHWTLADAGLELRDLKTGGVELRTSRVFLDPVVAQAAPRGMDALTYLVNELRAGDKATPYSMVTALDAPSSGFLPAELADDEIAITQWLADDLGVREGGKVTLKYLVMGERRQLEEKTREFTVLAVIPMNEPQLNASWMPDFPGLADVENNRDWNPGFDIDRSKIRDKDEEYWDAYRGTPKAFVNIVIGQQMWGNRWGELTAIRYARGQSVNLARTTSAPCAETSAAQDSRTDPAAESKVEGRESSAGAAAAQPDAADLKSQIATHLRSKLTPEQLGFQFIPLREQALAATDAPVDFGQLFVSFSFFLIVAAAVLTALLFVFSIEQRREQAGTLLALGWRPAQVRRLFLLEGAALALIGSLLGAAGALLYTRLVLRALATVWKDAVGAVTFVFAPNAMTLAIGIVAGVAVAVLAMWLASRRQFRLSARALLAGESLQVGKARRAFPRPLGVRASEDAEGSASLPYHWIAGAVCVLGAFVLAVWGGGSAGAFFGAGALLLWAGLLIALAWLRRTASGAGLDDIAQLGARNASRRRGRSMATIAVLASGVFIVVAVDSFRKRTTGPTTDRASGTGGFALLAESALPIYDDLNTTKGREAFALGEEAMRDVSVVPMRVREGDDASCLNLNRALQPRLLGARPQELASREAFQFSAEPKRGGAAMDRGGWAWLEGEAEDGAVPAIADAATVQWALQKKLGDTIEYRDERGQPFKVRLKATVAGSILQGQLVISEANFIEKFPSAGGYRSFLIDAPLARAEAVAAALSRALQDRGLEVTPAWRRLAELQAVENTYLSIFQVLGGLGLLLASAGLAIVVARNVLERRREFGLLAAVGFRRAQLRKLVFAEHRWLIGCGLAIGAASALLAVWPGLSQRGADFPWRTMALLLAALTAGSFLWAWVATRIALRGSGVAALRSE